LGKGIVIGLDKIISKLNDLPKDIQRDVDAVLAEGANDVVNLSRQLTPVDEGRLRNGTTAARLGPAAYEISNNVFYAPYIEFGTGPKYKPQPGYEAQAAEAKNLPKRGNFKDFVRNIYAWMLRKGLLNKTQSAGKRVNNIAAAYDLARRILAKGIEPRQFFFKAWEAYKPKILADVEKVVTKKR
jgi:hypothetical protein